MMTTMTMVRIKITVKQMVFIDMVLLRVDKLRKESTHSLMLWCSCITVCMQIVAMDDV